MRTCPKKLLRKLYHDIFHHCLNDLLIYFFALIFHIIKCKISFGRTSVIPDTGKSFGLFDPYNNQRFRRIFIYHTEKTVKTTKGVYSFGSRIIHLHLPILHRYVLFCVAFVLKTYIFGSTNH